MKENYSEEIKEIIKRYKKENIKFAKPINFLLERVKTTKQDIERELFNLNDLEFVEKQERSGETRYVLFFMYSNRRGREYVITFNENLTIITIFPLGRKTIRKYYRKRFIK